MNRVWTIVVRLCLLAVIGLQSGCITLNLIEPWGPMQRFKTQPSIGWRVARKRQAPGLLFRQGRRLCLRTLLLLVQGQ